MRKNRLDLTVEEAEKLISIMPDDKLKEFCRLFFIEKLSKEQVAQRMGYCVRQVERIKAEVYRTALKMLLQQVTNNSKEQ